MRRVEGLPPVAFRIVPESTDQLRERYQRLDAEYRAFGKRLRQLLNTRGQQPNKEADELFRQLRELNAQMERVQKELRERLAAEGQ